jgi:hypothetical protein
MSAPTYGRRQAFLVLLGVIYVVFGAANAVPSIQTGDQSPWRLPLSLVDSFGFWGGLWVVAGVTGIVTAFWPKEHDHIGFAALAAWSAAWAVLGVGSTLIYHSDRGWISGLIWGTFSGIVLIVSGMYGKAPNGNGST